LRYDGVRPVQVDLVDSPGWLNRHRHYILDLVSIGHGRDQLADCSGPGVFRERWGLT
jgi:hypothetical protein